MFSFKKLFASARTRIVIDRAEDTVTAYIHDIFGTIRGASTEIQDVMEANPNLEVAFKNLVEEVKKADWSKLKEHLKGIDVSSYTKNRAAEFKTATEHLKESATE